LGYSVDTKPGFFGALQAYDVNTGKRLWRDLYANSLNWGSTLSTAGGLVFAGGTNDRMFRAYDAKSGEELWHFKTNSGIIAPPSSFAVNGVQYVAVESGWGVDAAFNQSLMADLVGWNPDVPQGGMVWVFAVQR
jgi:alcohol dehydrogenase (cytochrome c)